MTPAPGGPDSRDHDFEDTLQFPAISGDERPGCGTPETAARFLVVFLDEGGVVFAEHQLCCCRHVPHPVEVLPEGAQLLEVVVADAQLTTVLTDDGAEITAGGQTTFIPASL
jgi:hypothetical protein